MIQEICPDFLYHKKPCRAGFFFNTGNEGDFLSGGIADTYNTISAYLHELNFVSTVFRLVLAMALSTVIGIDRGLKRRVAGVKTHVVVCVGATLVMMTGQFIHLYVNGAGTGDTARLGAQVISGVGFLGVGTIIVTGQKYVSGLTTAASLWATSCIGLALGIGFYSGAILAALCLLIVFRYFKAIDIYVENHSNVFEVYMEFENNEYMSTIIKKLREEHIKVTNVVVIKKKTKTQNVLIQASLEAEPWMTRRALFRTVEGQKGLLSVEEL